MLEIIIGGILLVLFINFNCECQNNDENKNINVILKQESTIFVCDNLEKYYDYRNFTNTIAINNKEEVKVVEEVVVEVVVEVVEEVVVEVVEEVIEEVIEEVVEEVIETDFIIKNNKTFFWFIPNNKTNITINNIQISQSIQKNINMVFITYS